MATSQQKSKVAQTRIITGETAEAFADIIGKSLSTLRSLETGRLKLSEKTALEISSATGVSFGWLLSGKNTPPVCGSLRQELPYTKESFVHHTAKKRRPRLKEFNPELKLWLHFAFRDIFMAVYGAAENGNGDIALYYLEKFAADLGKQFPAPKDRGKAARQLNFLGEGLSMGGVVEEDEEGGSNVPLPTPQKKQPFPRKRPA